MAVMASTFAGLVTSLAVMRDNGQLKRLRGTPLPPWAFFTGQIASRLVANADAAPAPTQAAFLPLLFLSGAWIPLDNRPRWLASLANAFRSSPCWTACGRR